MSFIFLWALAPAAPLLRLIVKLLQSRINFLCGFILFLDERMNDYLAVWWLGRFSISNRPCLHPCTLEKWTPPRQLLRSPSRMSVNNEINVLFFHVIHEFIKPQPHLNALPGLTAKIFWLLTFVFSNIATVQILHEPEEGQFIEENLRDLHQKVFSTVL